MFDGLSSLDGAAVQTDAHEASMEKLTHQESMDVGLNEQPEGDRNEKHTAQVCSYIHVRSTQLATHDMISYCTYYSLRLYGYHIAAKYSSVRRA